MANENSDYPGVYPSTNGKKCLIRWKENGKKRSETLDIPYTDRGRAQAFAVKQQFRRDYKLKVATNTQYEADEVETMTFAEASARYLTGQGMKEGSRETIKDRLNKFWGPIMDRPIHLITRKQVIKDILEGFPGHLANRTKKGLLSAGSSVFTYAIDNEWIETNPCLRLQVRFKKKQQKTLSLNPFMPEEVTQILTWLQAYGGERDRSNRPRGSQYHLFYALRIHAGLRPGEVIALTWSDYRNGRLSITKARTKGRLDTPKHGMTREVFVNSSLAAILADAFVEQYGDGERQPQRKLAPIVRQSQHVGRAFNLNPANTDRLSRANGYTRYEAFPRRLHDAMLQLGIEDRNPYACRHTCASVMLTAGMKSAYCAKQLGHDKAVFDEIYASWLDGDANLEQEALWNAASETLQAATVKTLQAATVKDLFQE